MFEISWAFRLSCGCLGLKGHGQCYRTLGRGVPGLDGLKGGPQNLEHKDFIVCEYSCRDLVWIRIEKMQTLHVIKMSRTFEPNLHHIQAHHRIRTRLWIQRLEVDSLFLW